MPVQTTDIYANPNLGTVTARVVVPKHKQRQLQTFLAEKIAEWLAAHGLVTERK